jgi:hypothetical protein
MFLKIDNTYINRAHITHMDLVSGGLSIRIHAPGLSGGYIVQGPFADVDESFARMEAIAAGTYGGNS